MEMLGIIDKMVAVAIIYACVPVGRGIGVGHCGGGFSTDYVLVVDIGRFGVFEPWIYGVVAGVLHYGVVHAPLPMRTEIISRFSVGFPLAEVEVFFRAVGTVVGCGQQRR